VREGFARISGNKSDRMSTSDVPHSATPQMDEIFYFGKFKIDPSEVFLVTDHSYTFVNLKPVVPGKFITTCVLIKSLFRFLCLFRCCDNV
jgi:hypothetical protein